jgi:hypothetical protein
LTGNQLIYCSFAEKATIGAAAWDFIGLQHCASQTKALHSAAAQHGAGTLRQVCGERRLEAWDSTEMVRSGCMARFRSLPVAVRA